MGLVSIFYVSYSQSLKTNIPSPVSSAVLTRQQAIDIRLARLSAAASGEIYYLTSGMAAGLGEITFFCDDTLGNRMVAGTRIGTVPGEMRFGPKFFDRDDASDPVHTVEQRLQADAAVYDQHKPANEMVIQPAMLLIRSFVTLVRFYP